MNRQRQNRRRKGVIPIIVAVLAGSAIFLGTAAFSAGIQGDFQGVNGTSGDGTSSGGVVSAGDDGCYLDTTLDLTTANVRNVQGTITGYYSPREGQAKYNKGNFADEKRMNAPNDPHTASGIDVARGAIAVDTSVFPFGTVFEIDGYGKGIAVDRGGKIGNTHLDAWSGIGDAGLEAANTIGSKIRIFKVYSWPGLSDAQLRDSIKRVCSPAMAGGKGCPAIASNAANISSRLQIGVNGLFNNLPGRQCNRGDCSRYWCTDLVFDSYYQAGFHITTNQSAAGMGEWFRNSQIYIPNGSGVPSVGDMILMYGGGASGRHVGVVRGMEGSCVVSAEANSHHTSSKYCLANGRYAPSYIIGFGRLKNCQ